MPDPRFPFNPIYSSDFGSAFQQPITGLFTPPPNYGPMAQLLGAAANQFLAPAANSWLNNNLGVIVPNIFGQNVDFRYNTYTAQLGLQLQNLNAAQYGRVGTPQVEISDFTKKIMSAAYATDLTRLQANVNNAKDARSRAEAEAALTAKRNEITARSDSVSKTVFAVSSQFPQLADMLYGGTAEQLVTPTALAFRDVVRGAGRVGLDFNEIEELFNKTTAAYDKPGMFANRFTRRGVGEIVATSLRYGMSGGMAGDVNFDNVLSKAAELSDVLDAIGKITGSKEVNELIAQLQTISGGAIGKMAPAELKQQVELLNALSKQAGLTAEAVYGAAASMAAAAQSAGLNPGQALGITNRALISATAGQQLGVVKGSREFELLVTQSGLLEMNAALSPTGRRAAALNYAIQSGLITGGTFNGKTIGEELNQLRNGELSSDEISKFGKYISSSTVLGNMSKEDRALLTALQKNRFTNQDPALAAAFQIGELKTRMLSRTRLVGVSDSTRDTIIEAMLNSAELDPTKVAELAELQGIDKKTIMTVAAEAGNIDFLNSENGLAKFRAISLRKAGQAALVQGTAEAAAFISDRFQSPELKQGLLSLLNKVGSADTFGQVAADLAAAGLNGENIKTLYDDTTIEINRLDKLAETATGDEASRIRIKRMQLENVRMGLLPMLQTKQIMDKVTELTGTSADSALTKESGEPGKLLMDMGANINNSAQDIIELLRRILDAVVGNPESGSGSDNNGPDLIPEFLRRMD